MIFNKQVSRLIDVTDELAQEDVLVNGDGYGVVKELIDEGSIAVPTEVSSYDYDGYGYYVEGSLDDDDAIVYTKEAGLASQVGFLNMSVSYEKIPKIDEEDDEEAQRMKRTVSLGFNTIDGKPVIFKKLLDGRDVNFPFTVSEIITM